MIRKYPKLIAAILMCTLLVSLGCSSEKGGSSGGVEAAFGSSAVWSSGCFDSDRFGLTMASRFEIQGEAFSRTNNYFSDGSCSDLAVVSVEEGTLSRTAAPDNPSAGSIDFSYLNVEVTPVGQPGILALNAVSYCGNNDWQLNASRNVTNSSGGAACWDRTPRTIRDIYLVDGSTILFGTGSDKQKGDSAIRPTALDSDRAWRIE